MRTTTTRRTILIITPYFPPAGGGLERYAMQIAGRLHRDHGWRVVMVSATAQPGQPDVRFEQDGLTVYQLSYRLRLSNTPLGLLWRRKLRRIIQTERPDVINAHTPVPGLADIAAGAAGRIPFVLTYHTGTMKKGHAAVDAVIGAYERWLLPRLFRRADRIVASSQFVQKFIPSTFQPKTRIITPATDPTIFLPPAPRTRRHNLLFVANYGPAYEHKGLRHAIRALAALAPDFPDLTLTAIGKGDAAPYRRLARRLGIADRLHFLPMLGQPDLAPHYQRAAVLVVPSKEESFGMTIVEAMASGLPVVANNVGGIPTIISDQRTGLLVPPGDDTALAAAVRRLLTDTSLRHRLAAAGLRTVAERFTWDTAATATHQTLLDAQKPHIAQVTAFYPPHIGGLENVVKELSETLADKGFTVDVLTSDRGPEAAPAVEQSPGLRVTRHRSVEILQTPIMAGFVRSLWRQPAGTVIHIHISQALVPELTLLVAKLRGLPLISHIHLDVDPSTAIGRIIFRPYKRTFLRFVLRHSDRVITLSHDQRDLMIRKYNLDPQRVFMLPNGVSTSYFLPARTQSHTPLRLLYVGRLAVQKRPERIVEAMRQLPGAHLDVIGNGDARPQLEAYVHEHGLTNVTFHGIKRGAELRAFYAAADVFVLPSDKEGMPLVLLEAMASALPIVGSDVLGIRELITGIGVLVQRPSADSFAAAIQDLTRHPSRLTDLSARSRTAGAAYSWDTLADSLTAQYHELASSAETAS